MPLDQDLINKSTTYSRNCLSHLVPTCSPHLFLIDNFLHPEMLEKLINFVSIEDVKWELDTWKKDLNRLKLDWVFDSVIEEVHIVLENLTRELNQKFNKTNKFIGLTIWKDLKGYTIAEHTDNEMIDMALQIYLTEHDTIDLSTHFKYAGQITHPIYKINSGYLEDNVIGIPHYMSTPVPIDHTRLSLYAIWSKR